LDRILPPVNGKFELLGEFRGSFVAERIGRETSAAATGPSAATGASTAARVSAATGLQQQ
jgi:hypothetical protein